MSIKDGIIGFRSSIKKTTIIKKEPTISIEENKGIKPLSSLKSIYNFADISKLINILIPPVKGVGRLWNFLLLSGRSTRMLFVFAMFLANRLMLKDTIALIIR